MFDVIYKKFKPIISDQSKKVLERIVKINDIQKIHFDHQETLITLISQNNKLNAKIHEIKLELKPAEQSARINTIFSSPKTNYIWLSKFQDAEEPFCEDFEEAEELANH